ncbi:MAG: peptide chain release factor N(5)-glutamine methyltransferase [Alphaproteobacteria bacterium]|nr:peptide chain release factor N(5)-glutamine methyltransferase [Alphaproteobacteria bacterium]MCD8571538.1 peptide chain release factor N(5)-glutamine methyltransferase [Alphaproteobacteria bacterium]
MKLSHLQKHLTQTLADAGIEAADQEARLILETRLELSWADLISQGDREVDPSSAESDLQKRISGMSLGRIYGQKNFYGLDFTLSPDTLEPRADTEILIDIARHIYKEKPPETILDLGTGTGCILLALLHSFPQARGLGIDKAAGAVATAQQNALNLKMSARAVFQQGDWASGITERFDLVVSNPPYIDSGVIPVLAEEVRNHDPILALDGGIDGMDAYEKIFHSLG